MEDLTGVRGATVLFGLMAVGGGALPGWLLGDAWSAATGGALLVAVESGATHWVQGEFEDARGRRLLAEAERTQCPDRSEVSGIASNGHG